MPTKKIRSPGCLLYTSIGLELNRGLRDENGEIYDIVAGTFLVVGLGEEDFASLSPELIQKYTEPVSYTHLDVYKRQV